MSFISKRCLSHFCASGPEGMCASSFMSVPEQNSKARAPNTKEVPEPNLQSPIPGTGAGQNRRSSAAPDMLNLGFGLSSQCLPSVTEQDRDGNGNVTEEDHARDGLREPVNQRAVNRVLQPE